MKEKQVKDNIESLAGTSVSLRNILDNVEIDQKELEGLEIEDDKFAWYCTRFKQVCEDGVPMAINEYLKKLLTDDVNALTRVAILHESMKFLH